MSSGTMQKATKETTYSDQPAESSTTSLSEAKENLLEAFEQLVDVMTTAYQPHNGGSSPEVPGTGGKPGTGMTGTSHGTGTSHSSGSSTGSSGTGSSGSEGTTGTASTGTSSTGSKGSHESASRFESTATTHTLHPGEKSAEETWNESAPARAAKGKPPSGKAAKPSETTSATTASSGNGKQDSEAYAAAISGLREAYRWDMAREATRMPRRLETKGQTPRTAPESAPRDKHTRDSNTAPVREEREFAPAFGKAGRPRGATQEVVAVRVPASARPETAPESVQAGPKLDAYWASYHSPMERAQERLRIIRKATSEAIIGTDERVRVTNTQDYPFRCICSLLITANTGSQYLGTGWLVAPRLLLTAGHCVYMADENGWASQIEVMPGRDAENYPYGSVIATDMRSITGWTMDGDRDFDYGAILLPSERRLGDELGWFGYAVRTDDYFPGIDLNLSGYPGDGGPAGIDGTQWQDHRTVKDVKDRQISYEIDTYGGQSGAPVWETTSDGSRYGLAIHTWGTSTSNGATRITSDVFDNLVAWAAEVP